MFNKLSKYLFFYSFIALVFFLSSIDSYALVFDLPKDGSRIVGTPTNTVVGENEDFSDIAQEFDLGYYELFEANPGVDADDPPVNTELVIPTEYILPAELHNNIVINLPEMRLYFQPKDENKVYIFPVGIGKADWETPVGTYKITEKIIDPKWIVPNSIYKFRQKIGDTVPRVVMPGPDNPLGKYALRLSSKDFILVHGTNAPEGVGRRSSAGCIRLYPHDIDMLFHMVSVGTPVTIINSPYKVVWKNNKIYLESHMPLFEQRVHLGTDTSPVTHLVEAIDAKHTASIDWPKVTRIAEEHVVVPQVVGKMN